MHIPGKNAVDKNEVTPKTLRELRPLFHLLPISIKMICYNFGKIFSKAGVMEFQQHTTKEITEVK